MLRNQSKVKPTKNLVKEELGKILKKRILAVVKESESLLKNRSESNNSETY